MKCYLMGLKHCNNVASACAPPNIGLAHELIEGVVKLGQTPFDFTIKALTVKCDGIHYSDDLSIIKTIWLNYQPNSLAWPLFSEKLKTIIERELTGKEGVKWISSNVCYKNEIRKYYIPYFTRELDVLNKKKCLYSNNGSLIKPVFSSSKIQEYSMFPKPSMNGLWQITSAIYISDKVKEVLIKAKISGLAFEPTLIY